MSLPLELVFTFPAQVCYIDLWRWVKLLLEVVWYSHTWHEYLYPLCRDCLCWVRSCFEVARWSYSYTLRVPLSLIYCLLMSLRHPLLDLWWPNALSKFPLPELCLSFNNVSFIPGGDELINKHEVNNILIDYPIIIHIS